MSAVDRHDSPTIRVAGASDAERLIALMRLLAMEEGSAEALRADAHSLLRDGFGSSPRFHALLAEAGSEVVGYASYTLGYSIWAGGSTLLLDDLFVAREWRGHGIGRQLLQAVRGICVQQAHVHARWTVEPGNEAAIRLYEGVGARVAPKGVCTWET